MARCLTVLASLILVTTFAHHAQAQSRRLLLVRWQPPAGSSELLPPPAIESPAPRWTPAPLQRPTQKGYPIQKLYVGKPISQPLIAYVQHCPLKRARCHDVVQTVLRVKNPLNHCLVDVPVCIPCDCDKLAAVHGHAGVLGKGAVGFHWCCGYKLKVVFNKHGDVVVHYYG